MWRKWYDFSFQHFIFGLWQNFAAEFSNIDDFVPLVGCENFRDRKVALRSKEVISSKVFMAKLVSLYRVP
jgi:hypothetical protein